MDIEIPFIHILPILHSSFCCTTIFLAKLVFWRWYAGTQGQIENVKIKDSKFKKLKYGTDSTIK